MTLLPFLAILISVLGLLVSGGAMGFFMKYGTRLAMVEKQSSENTAKIEKHATDLIQANTQVALVAAALESIKSALTELKQDVKQWMREQREHSASEGRYRSEGTDMREDTIFIEYATPMIPVRDTMGGYIVRDTFED